MVKQIFGCERTEELLTALFCGARKEGEKRLTYVIENAGNLVLNLWVWLIDAWIFASSARLQAVQGDIAVTT